MKKKTLFVVVCIYIIFYILNYLTPMSFGDDYVYAFIWQGHSEYVPLTEEAVRVSSVHDLLISQWSHYFTWSGRTVSHTIAQFFLWMGKDIFNIFNALISVLLVAEIYWCANKGLVTLDFKISRLVFIFFAFWAFTPAFSQVFLWLTGACNYLWTAVLLLGFLLPYVRKYYFFEEKIANNNWFRYAMFFFGIIVGWSNENSICWIIMALLVFICANRKRSETESWMAAGFVGLLIGYAFLMFAPGNFVRLQVEAGAFPRWISNGWGLVKAHIDMLIAVLFFQFLLWYFSLRSLHILQKESLKSDVIKREQSFVQMLCILSIGMTGMMLFSPNFPPRSAFPGTTFLIIAASVLLRIQNEYSITVIRKRAIKLLCVFGAGYFLISSTTTLYSFYNYHMQIKKILSFVCGAEQAKKEIVIIPSLVPVSESIAQMTGFRLLYYEMSEDPNDWRNVAFARYYGIKGIRIIKKDFGKPDSQ